MSEYRLEVNGTIGLSDYANINDYMNIIGENDKVVISIGPGDAHNVEILTNMLQHNGLEIAIKGGHDDGRYYITAYRRGDEFKG